jgi:hypothetical protein
MSKQLEHLFSIENSPPYEWNEFHVFKHPLQPRKYFFDIDSDCSCSNYELPSLEFAKAATPVGKLEVYAAFSTWWDSTNEEDQSMTKAAATERLRASL